MSSKNISHQEKKSESSKLLACIEKRQDNDFTASDNSSNVLFNNKLSWQDLIEHERTAGGPAVMQGKRDGGPGGPLSPSSSVPAPSQANAIPDNLTTDKRVTRLVGFKKLRSLLQPLHRYFQDKVGFIRSFRVYQNEKNDLAYPEVQVWHRDNPYRRHQLVHKASQRTFKKLKALVNEWELGDFMVASIVLTMPKLVSEFLASKGNSGRGMAWRLHDGWWDEDLPLVICQDVELGCHVNLHLWRTEVPIEPHFHFHSLIPNYGVRWGDGSGVPKRWEWHRQRGGRLVPFSDEQLIRLKNLWRNRLSRFCKRHGLGDIEGKVDIYVEYIDIWPKLLHRLNYNGRHWSENYAEYSNDNPGCSDPPEWLQHYENKARVKGWWSNIKNVSLSTDQEKEKISPYTGEPMVCLNESGYWGDIKGWTLGEVVKFAGGELGCVEFVRGQPVENMLSDDDFEWLKGVMSYEARMPDVEISELDTT